MYLEIILKSVTIHCFYSYSDFLNFKISDDDNTYHIHSAHVGLYPGILAAVFCATFDFIAAMFLIYASEITQIFEYSRLLRNIGIIWEYSGAICLLYVVSGIYIIYHVSYIVYHRS